MKKIITLSLLSSLIVLAGCATTVNLTPQQRERIHTITINPRIPVPNQVSYFGDTSRTGMLFRVAAGGLIALGIMDSNESKKLTQLVQKNHISIQQIVLDEFIRQIHKSKLFILVKQNADAQLNIIIKVYGLRMPLGFSMKPKPILNVVANLTNSQNQIIWQREKVINVNENRPKYSLTAIQKNPILLKVMWNEAAKQIVTEMLQSLSGH